MKFCIIIIIYAAAAAQNQLKVVSEHAHNPRMGSVDHVDPLAVCLGMLD